MGSMCSKRPITINNKPHKTLSKYSKASDYRKKYEFMKLLGNGAFGKVRLYADKSCRDMKYAIKTIRKDGVSKAIHDCIIEEVTILRDLDHPNIVKYYETYEDDHYINLVMEYIPADDLFKVISMRKHNRFSEKDAVDIIKCMFKALLFIHNKQIVHRDIKPENILFSVSGDYHSLKLIDFGLSASGKSKSKQRVGSPYYMAPEIINGSYTYKTDIWSVGVILYVLITGVHPFDGVSQQQVFDKILFEKYDEATLNSKKCSSEVKDLIDKLLIKDESMRWSIDEALEHPWFKQYEDKFAVYILDNDIIDSLKKFASTNLFQKEIMFYLAKISKDEEVQKLKQSFSELDKDNTGTLEFEEIFIAFENVGIKINKVIIYYVNISRMS